MATLFLIVMFIFVAMLAPKFAAVALIITLLVGLLIKFITQFVAGEVTLTQCIKAVFFSVLLNILANAFVGEALSNFGLFGSILGVAIVFAACTLAFSMVLDLTIKPALVVSAAFWLVTFPVFIWLGISSFGKTVGVS